MQKSERKYGGQKVNLINFPDFPDFPDPVEGLTSNLDPVKLLVLLFSFYFKESPLRDLLFMQGRSMLIHIVDCLILTTLQKVSNEAQRNGGELVARHDADPV